MHSLLHEHLGLISDPVRLARYRNAIGSVVKHGDRVADLGCGAGVLGVLSLQAGAAKIYAIDQSVIIEVARESIARAGLGDRASFIRGRSQQVDLPERVDVLVCDHVGWFGFDYGIVELFGDARARFLKPGGAIIPAAFKLQLAAVESDRCHELAQAWRADDVPAEFRWLRDYSVNSKHHVSLQREDLLGRPAGLGTIDLGEDQTDFFSWSAELPIDRDGVVHGLGGWCDCKLAEGVWMTNSPLEHERIRRTQVFLPIGEPVPARAGDRLNVTVMARPGENLLAWTVEFPANGPRFSHSTWQGMLMSPDDLARARPNRVPRPNREGLARGIVLGYCDGRRTAREIEESVVQEHPDLFPSRGEIFRFVAHVLGRDAG